MSRFIFAQSTRFGLLVALTSKPPSENEHAEVSYVCSQPSCHPTELQSSFHSELQPSFHSSHSSHRSRECQWCRFLNVRSCLRFRVFKTSLCKPLAPWFELLVPLDFPLDFLLFSLLFPLSSLLDHDLLCLPLPDDCLRALACCTVSLKMCSTAR